MEWDDYAVGGKGGIIEVYCSEYTYLRDEYFQITDGILDKIHHMTAPSWRGSTDQRHHIHWKRWVCLCLPKNLGETGFMDLEVFNESFASKASLEIVMRY